MAAMEKHLKELLDECDEKIKQLGDLNIKWTEFNKNLGDLKSWVGQAKSKLDQILKIDISPEDRVRMTMQLQHDVKDKMGQLEKLESDASQLLGDLPPDSGMFGLKSEVATVKKDVEALNTTVNEHTSNATQDLEHWQNYQTGLNKVKPWLEKAEVKIAMGLKRPVSLDDARAELDEITTFSVEVDGMKDQIAEASVKGDKISSSSVGDEVDALQSRWQAVKTTSDQWKQKMTQLVSLWQTFDEDYEHLNKWLDSKADILSTPLNETTLDVNDLSGSLASLKDLNNDLAQKQSLLLSLSREGENVAGSLNQDCANDLRGKVGSMKQKLSDLCDESRRRVNTLTDAITNQQDFQVKLDEFKNWQKDFSSRTNALNEVPVDQIDSCLETAHDLSQEHEDKVVPLNKIKADIVSTNKAGSVMDQFKEMEKKHKEHGKLLEDKKSALKRWSSFWIWHAESLASLQHLQQTLESGGQPSQRELENASSELENLAVQCQTRKSEGSDDEETAAKSKTYVMQNRKPMSILLLVANILQKIVDLKSVLGKKAQQLQDVDEKWDEFKVAEQKLADWLQKVLQEVQKINVKESNIDSLKQASAAVTKLAQDCDSNNVLREDYQNIGRELLKSDPSQSKIIQDAIREANSKWEKVTNLLKEQRSKSQSLIAIWEQSIEQKKSVVDQLNNCQDILDSLSDLRPQSPSEAANQVDQCKKGLDAVKKVRHPFETFYKRQTQLIQELSTVPGFDTSGLKKELQVVQQQFSQLGMQLKAKLNGLDSQLVVWRQLQQSRDELVSWLTDARKGMDDAMRNISDTELARIKLSKYQNELPSYTNIKTGIDAKIEQITAMNGGQDMPGLKHLSEDLAEELGAAEETSKALDCALGDIKNQTTLVRDDIKNVLEWLAKLRESIVKLDDATGSDEDICERLVKVKDIQTELDSYDDKFSEIEQKLKDMKDTYGASDLSALTKETANLEKKHDTLSTQVNKITASLYGIIEKHYVEKVQDEMKAINNNKEKTQWCHPNANSDKYGLETKLDTITEIEDRLESNKNGATLEKSAEIVLRVVDSDKGKEIEETVKCLGQEKNILLEEVRDIKAKIQALLDRWRKYEASFESTSGWLRRVEDDFRTQMAVPVQLDSFKEASKKLTDMKAELDAHEPEIGELLHLSSSIIEEAPEVRINQQSQQLKKRFENTKDSLVDQIGKLNELFESKGAQNEAIKEFEKWLAESKKKLKVYEELGKVENKPIPNDKLDHMKKVLNEKEEGHNLLEKAIEAGENLFAYIAPKDRDGIRAHIREMRDSWESHIDYMNNVQRAVEAIAMKWASFEENHGQIRKWINSSNEALAKDVPLAQNLQDKKSSLQNYKSLQQDIVSHDEIMKNLSENVKGLGNQDANSQMAKSYADYEALKAKVAERVAVAQRRVANHEEYQGKMEKSKDMIVSTTKELDLLMVAPLEKDTAPERISVIDNLLGVNDECETIIAQCGNQQATVLAETSTFGREILEKEAKDNVNSLKELIQKARDFKEQLKSLSGKWDGLQKDLDNFAEWLKAKEFQIKDQVMKDTVESKQRYAEYLKEIQREVIGKGSSLEIMTKDADKAEPDSEVAALAAQLNNRYNLVNKNVKEIKAKYDCFVKEHQSFNDQYAAFTSWMKMMNDDLESYSEVVGDLRVLQERKNNLDELEDMRTNECAKFDSIMELGERLYSHTSTDGKEIIRSKLQSLRLAWEKLTEDVQNTTNKLDTCLQQFADFSNLQEQLTKWLKDIEAAMTQHTELRASLEEKKGQLQSHKIVHQEITTHNSLVDAVCNKAQELVDQTQDKTLNIYIDSIKALFKNIGLKSKDLMDKLNSCVLDHNNYTTLLKSFSDFSANQADLLSQCADISGEKTDLDRKHYLLKELKDNKAAGDKRLDELSGLCSAVCKSTSPKGCQRLRQELLEIKESWNTQSACIEDVEINIEKGMGQWKQFENDLARHGDWFKIYEGIFRNQQLQGTLEDKQEKLKMFNEKRQDVIDYEKTVDDFVNHAHNLLQNSGAERLKPAITQISNRYQLLHVLSKEVVAKWQGLVEEHQHYDEKLVETHRWLNTLDDQIERAMKEMNADIKTEMLQIIIAEQERAPVKLNDITAVGERLFPDTGTKGREEIRTELRKLRERWDAILDRAEKLQRKQEAQALAWTKYQECLQQATQWLESMENGVQNENMNWLSIQETRSRLLKLKTDLQDVASHKRFIETVNEKGAAVVQANPHAAADDIQVEIEGINERYAELTEKMKNTIGGMEESIEYIQQYQDLQKAHQEWQKQLWDKLSIYTDNSGNKITLENRLQKLKNMDSSLLEGKNNISSMKKHIAEIDQDKLPKRAIEAMERDISNMHYDYEKFTSAVNDAKQSLQSRLSQWAEYEGQFDKIIHWLGESEKTLKSFSPKGSLEEKQEQMERFQVWLSNYFLMECFYSYP